MTSGFQAEGYSGNNSCCGERRETDFAVGCCRFKSTNPADWWVQGQYLTSHSHGLLGATEILTPHFLCSHLYHNLVMHLLVNISDKCGFSAQEDFSGEKYAYNQHDALTVCGANDTNFLADNEDTDATLPVPWCYFLLKVSSYLHLTSYKAIFSAIHCIQTKHYCTQHHVCECLCVNICIHMQR